VLGRKKKKARGHFCLWAYRVTVCFSDENEAKSELDEPPIHGSRISPSSGQNVVA